MEMSDIIVLSQLQYGSNNNSGVDFSDSNVLYDKNTFKSDNVVNETTIKVKPSYRFQGDENMLNIINKPSNIILTHDYTKLKFIQDNDKLIPLDSLTTDSVSDIKTLRHSIEDKLDTKHKKYIVENNEVIDHDYVIGPSNFELNHQNFSSTIDFSDVNNFIESIWSCFNPYVKSNDTLTPIELNTLVDYNSVQQYYNNRSKLYSDSTIDVTQFLTQKVIDNKDLYSKVYIVKQPMLKIYSTSLKTLRDEGISIYFINDVEVFNIIEYSSDITNNKVRNFAQQFSLSIVTLYDLILSLAIYYISIVRNKCYEHYNYSQYYKDSKLIINKLGYSVENIQDIDKSTINNNSIGKTLELMKDNIIIPEDEMHNKGINLITGKWGNCDWTLDYFGVLKIQGGKYASGTSNNKSIWYDYKDKIKEIYINGLIQFYPNTDLSYLFAELSSVEILEGLDNVDTTNVINMSHMFYNMNNVISLDISNLITSSVTDMTKMFSNCCKLKSLDLNSFDTSLVTSFKSMFDSINVETLNLSSFNTRKVTDMSLMFNNCDKLMLVIFNGDFITSNVTTMNSMFKGCKLIKDIDVSKFDTTSVTDIREMFKDCQSLDTLDLSNFDLNSLSEGYTSDLLKGCVSLIKFTTPNDFGSLVEYIDNNVENILMSMNTKNPTSETPVTLWKVLGSKFKYAQLTTLLANTTYIRKVEFYWGECKCYEENDIIYISEGKAESTKVLPFDKYKSTCVKIVFEGNVTFDTNTSLDNLFKDFVKLESIEGLDKLDTTNVVSMNSMFEGCVSLFMLDLSKLIVTNIQVDTTLKTAQVNNFIKGTTELFRFTSPTFTTTDSGNNNAHDNIVSIVIASSINDAKWKEENSSERFIKLTQLKSNTSYIRETRNIWGISSDGCPYYYRASILYIAGGRGVNMEDSVPWVEYIDDITKIVILGPIRFNQDSNIAGLFSNHTKLVEIEGLSNVDVSNIVNISSLFKGCSLLESVDMTTWTLVSSDVQVKDIFKDCTNLVEFTTPAAFNNLIVSTLIESLGTNTKWKIKNSVNKYETLTTLATHTTYVKYGFGYWGECKFRLINDTINIEGGNVNVSYSVNSVYQSPFIDYSDVLSHIIIKDTITFDSTVVLDCLFKGLTKLRSISGLIKCEFGNIKRDNMFIDCNQLEDYDYNTFETNSVENFGSMFNNCVSLQSLDLSNFDFSSATDTTKLVNDCKSLAYIQTPLDNSDTAKTLEAELEKTYKRGNNTISTNGFDGVMMFNSKNANLIGTCCWTIENQVLTIGFGTIDSIPTELPWKDYKSDIKAVEILGDVNFSTPNTSLNGFFQDFNRCNKIIGLNHINLTNVTSIENMFSGCSSLTELDLSNWTLDGITISGMLFNCSKLDKFIAPTLTDSSILAPMLNNLGKWIEENNITGVYGELLTVTPKKIYYKSNRGKWNECYWYVDDTTLIIEATDEKYKGGNSAYVESDDGTKVYQSPFELTKAEIMKIVITHKIEFESNTVLDCLFKGFSSLVEIEGFNNLDTTNVVSMNSMFSGCTSLVTLDFSSFNLTNVTTIDNFLESCQLIRFTTSTTIPESINTKIAKSILPAYKLEGTEDEYIELTELKTESTYVMYSDNTWGDSKSVCSWIIKNNTLYISGGQGSSTIKNGDDYQTPWHKERKNIKYINLLGAISFKEGTILDGLFFNHSYLISIINLKNLNLSNVISVKSMFEGCSTLMTLDISELQLGNIKGANFSNFASGCSILYKLTIPSTLLSTMDTIDNIHNSLPSFRSWSRPRIDNPSFDKSITFQYWGVKCKYYVSENILVIVGGCTIKSGVNPLSSLLSSDLVEVKIIYPISFDEDSVLTSLFSGLTGVTVIEGLENLDTTNIVDMSCMFYNCSSLTEVDLTKINTCNVTNMSHMFDNCKLLITITFDEYGFKTDNVINMNAMFVNCDKLEALDFKNINTDKVTDMSMMFQNCSSLRRLDLSMFKTSNVLNMSNMFNNCGSLMELDVSSFDTSKVGNFNSMFQDCSLLTHLNLNSFNFKNVSSSSHIVNILNGNNLLQFTTPKKFDGDHMSIVKEKILNGLNINRLWKKIDDSGLFQTLYEILADTVYISSQQENKDDIYWGEDKNTGCRYKFIHNTLFIGSGIGTSTESKTPFNVSLFKPEATIDNVTRIKILGEIKFNKPTSLSGLFKDYTNLIEIDGLEHLNTDKVIDMSDMFSNCPMLVKVNLDGFITSAVTNMSNMFNSTSLIQLDLNHFDTKNLTNVTRMFYNCDKLVQLDLDGLDFSKVTSSTDLLTGCSKLLRLVTPDFKNNESIKTTFLEFMNSDQKYYWKIEESDDDFTTLESIQPNTAYVCNRGDLWGTCVWILNPLNGRLTISGGKGKSTNSTSPWINEAANIKEIRILGRITFDDSTILAGLFKDLHNLVFFNGFTNFDTSNVISMNSMFENCYKLKYLDGTAKNNDLKLETSNVTSFESMFSNCYSLRIMTLDEINTGRLSNINKMFNNCYSLNHIIFKTSNDMFSVVTSMNGTFNNCHNLIKLDLTNWNMSKVSDVDSMFKNCYNIQSIQFSDKYEIKPSTIKQIFYSCVNLTQLDLSMIGLDSVSYVDECLSGCDSLGELIAPSELPNETLTKQLESSVPMKNWFDKTGDIEYKDTEHIKLVALHKYVVLYGQYDSYISPSYSVYYLYKPNGDDTYTLEHISFGDLMLSREDFMSMTEVKTVRFSIKTDNEVTFRSEPFVINPDKTENLVISLPEIKCKYGLLHTLFNDLVLKETCILEYLNIELNRYDFKHIESVQNCSVTCDVILFNTVKQVTFICDELTYDEDTDRFIIKNGYCSQYPNVDFSSPIKILTDRIVKLEALGYIDTNDITDENLVDRIVKKPTLTINMKSGSRLIGIPRRFEIDDLTYTNTYIKPRVTSTQVLGLTEVLEIPYDTPIVYDSVEQKIRPVNYKISDCTEFKKWTSNVECGNFDAVDYPIEY